MGVRSGENRLGMLAAHQTFFAEPERGYTPSTRKTRKMQSRGADHEGGPKTGRPRNFCPRKKMKD